MDEALTTRGNEGKTHGPQLLVVTTSVVLAVLVTPRDHVAV
ncbi:hypothetical protein KPSA3_06071 [Pseudomonas syringae pv. actinidiae]|uniref:Uncharacterized protein n=1 Tax=Pseudomonas syringae pv. actinidiae TaxID=103796 RepID=A0AAN4Q9M0_PSESF|nr:hypothetical protein KPSA3_06071 [Pseudomonas syringae pv. actinidiae]